MKNIVMVIVLTVLANSILAETGNNNPGSATGFDEQYVMLYYDDLGAPAEFYGKLLGLEAIMDDDWVKLYQVTPGSFVGVVKEGKNAYHKVQDKNAVMVSLVTAELETWYKVIKDSGQVSILKEIHEHQTAPIRTFLIADPGGYTIEFFQWLK